jgi:hypothetical protein
MEFKIDRIDALKTLKNVCFSQNTPIESGLAPP